MSDTTDLRWDAFDIGKASTQVSIGPYWHMEDPSKPPNTAYQETWLSEALDANASREGLNVYPSDRYRDGWNSTTKRWRAVPQINAVVLDVNRRPGAPQHTLVYGRIGRSESTIPDLYVNNEDGAPSDDQYVSSPGSVVASPPMASAVGPLYDKSTPTIGPTHSIQQNQMYLYESPFIPTSFTDVAKDMQQTYRDYVEKLGYTQGSGDGAITKIPTWNIWHKVPLNGTGDGERYISDYGPDWSATTFRGSQLKQGGDAGGKLRAQIIATQSSARVKRMFPIWMDVGRALPWIFPYVDENGVPRHNLVVGPGAPAQGATYESVYDGNAMTPVANVGFIMNFDVTADTNRGSFFSSAGGSASVSIKWGTTNTDKSWISTFSVDVSPNKIPSLRYYNGEKIITQSLSNGPIDLSHIQLKVEYFGTDMSVQINLETERLVRGRNDLGGHPASVMGLPTKGVYVEEKTKDDAVEIVCNNCCVTFDFMPTYYNPWDPAQMVSMPASDPADDDPFMAYQFGGWDGTDDKKWTWENGLAKLVGIGTMQAIGGDDNTKSKNRADKVVQQVRANLPLQTYTLTEIVNRWRANKKDSAIDSDDGFPMVYLDSRMVRGDSVVDVVTARVSPATESDKTNSGQNPSNELSAFVTWSQPHTAIDIMIRARATHTTPVIFGIKIVPDGSYIDGNGLRDVTKYVSMWEVDWKELDEDHKIMRSTASLKLLNPPSWLMNALRNNQLMVEIKNSGYANLKNAMSAQPPTGTTVIDTSSALAPYVFRGFVDGTETVVSRSGEKQMTVTCVDPMLMLERAVFETNVRYDGMSYTGAFCLSMKATEYQDMLRIRTVGKDGTETDVVPSPKWMGGSGASSVYADLYFGYEPGAGNSYRVTAGSPVLQELFKIIKQMHNPNFYPLFFYDPSGRSGLGAFVLTFRDRTKSMGAAKLLGPPLQANDFVQGLPLTGETAVTVISDTGGLRSHFTVVGADRFTGLLRTVTAASKVWQSLKGVTDPMLWQAQQGHIGFRSRVLWNDNESMLPDIPSLRKYSEQRMWWLATPLYKYRGMTVHGVVSPVGNQGMVSLREEGWEHDRLLLVGSHIVFNADEHSLKSTADALYVNGITSNNVVR